MITVSEMAWSELFLFAVILFVKWKYFPELKNDFLDYMVTLTILLFADLAWTYWACKAIQAGMVIK